MTSQQLKCFVSVADKLNFTKAAEELFLSTPTVTHHIKTLEEELGAALFIRTSKIVQLTEAGATFYSDAREILSKMTLAEKNIQKITNPNLSFLRIGCSSNAELGFLEEMLYSLQETYPRVYPQIFVHDYYTMKNLFANKQLDMFLATREMVKGIDHCSFRKLKSISNYAIVSRKSHLSSKKKLCFEDLEKECLIIPTPKFIPFQNGNKLQEKILLHSQSHFNLMCENDQAAILLAKCGYGTAILPEFFIPAEMDDIIIIPLTDEEDVMDYGIAYHKNSNTEYIKFLIRNFCFHS
ncbi:LysR family transcriptional regulator [bacterium D16-51]|nr:LysR family transcriptional regulator [bacterium D16-59]RKI57620.1 LysR family transcriptional regulator [bacterium D16-51]